MDAILLNNYSNITPEGTRDFLFEESDCMRFVETSLSNLFEKCGYRKIVTPSIEFFDVFNRTSSSIELEKMYKLTDLKGRLIVLRPDNTMPIARVAATRLSGAELPLRLYYNQNVFVQNRANSARSDEMSQSGVELIGAYGKRADLEIITMANDALASSGAPDYSIEIGHAGFLSAVLDEINIAGQTKEAICRLIESKNYAAVNDLLDSIGANDQIKALKKLPRLFGGVSVIDEASQLFKNKAANDALQYLKSIYNDLNRIGLGDKISIDLGIVNHNNYYTGIVLRGYIQGSGETVLSGGRYDNLISEFGKNAAAVGFGVSVSDLASAMYTRGERIPLLVPSRLVFAHDGYECDAISHSKTLSVPSEVFVGDTLAEALAYSKRRGIKSLDVIGENGVQTIDAEVE